MSKIACKKCNTLQNADVYETLILLGIKDSNINRFFILIIDSCKICSTMTAKKAGLLCDGHYINYGNIKKEKINNYLKYKIKKLDNLPNIAKEDIGSSRFYLNCNEYGQKKKCYSNLSTLQMGRLKSSCEDLKKPSLSYK